MYNHGTATLTDCTVSGNSAGLFGKGGGLFNQGTAMLYSCTVSGNSTKGGVVGGLYNRGNGGGMYNQGTATLTDCTVSGNTASNGFGGGLFNYGTATLTNCTVSGNSASFVGGGMYNGTFGNTTQAATATLTDCTVSGNSAGIVGGGVYNSFSSGTSTLGNTIVAGNTASNSGLDAYGTFTSLGHNLIGETDGSGGWVFGSDLTGSIASPLNALLGSLANNGGPTRTFALLPGSPAIDMSNNSLIPSGTTTDQRRLRPHHQRHRGHRRLRDSALPPEVDLRPGRDGGGAAFVVGQRHDQRSAGLSWSTSSSSSTPIKAPAGNAPGHGRCCSGGRWRLQEREMPA